MANQPHSQPAPQNAPDTRMLSAVQQAVQSLRFGQVVLTVRDGKVTQIDVTRRSRFD